MVRAYTAKLLGINMSNIRVNPAEIGGGFGGKTLVYLEPDRCRAVPQEVRPHGENADDAGRRVPRLRPDLRRDRRWMSRSAPGRMARSSPLKQVLKFQAGAFAGLADRARLHVRLRHV